MAHPPTLSRRHLLLLPAFIIPRSSTLAQATPADSSMREPPVAMRVATILPDLPGALSDMHLSQHTLASGVSVPPTLFTGPTLVLVRSGSVRLTSDVPVVFRRASETGQPEAIRVPNEGIEMRAGEGALVPEPADTSLANTGDEAADIGVLTITSLGTETVEPYSTPGVTMVGMGASPLPFRSGPAITIVEQVVMQPARSGYSSTFQGVEIGSVERGQARVLCQSGTTRVLPGPLTDSGVMEIEPGATIDLATGDGYTSHDGSLVWRSTGEEPLVICRAQVIPIPQPS